MKNKEYSGPWLWLALASFLMPIGVAVWAFRTLPQPFTYPEIQPDASGVDQELWNQLLQTYVADGLIDYEGLKRTHLFKTYLAQLASAEPDKLPDDDHRLAFYCNAYNAFVINGVLVHKIDGSVLDYKSKDGTGFFDLPEHILAGETISLNFLEHKIIREDENLAPKKLMTSPASTSRSSAPRRAAPRFGPKPTSAIASIPSSKIKPRRLPTNRNMSTSMRVRISCTSARSSVGTASTSATSPASSTFLPSG